MDNDDTVTDSYVEEALSAVLTDDKFAAAPQMSAFLKYVVTQTLYADPSRIKAYTVAVDALGKPATFDPQNDPSVRVLAKRLRGSLDTYYENNPQVEIIIKMKAGSYVPQFIRREQLEATQPVHPTLVTEPVSTATSVGTSVFPDSFSDASVDSPAQTPIPVAASSVINNNSFASDVNADQQTNDNALSAHHTESLAPQIPVPSLLHTESADELVVSQNAFAEPESAQTAQDEGRQADISIPDNHTVQESAPSTRGNEPTILDRFKAIPRPAIVMGLCAGLVWFAMSGNQEPDQERLAEVSLGAAMPEAKGIVGQELVSQLRPRPENLTIVGIDLSSDSTLGRSIVDTVSTVVSRFDHVDLHKQQHLIAGSQMWPEDYQIHLHVANRADSSDVNVQLIHARTSRVAFSETLSLKSNVDSELTEADYLQVQNSAARWMQADGPIVYDYHDQVSSHTKEMVCYMEAFSSHLSDKAPRSPQPSCNAPLNGPDTSTKLVKVYRAWKMLTDPSSSGAQANNPTQTLEVVSKAVEGSPYNSYAHITLAMAQDLVGDIDGSHRSVEKAMMLNPRQHYRKSRGC